MESLQQQQTCLYIKYFNLIRYFNFEMDVIESPYKMQVAFKSIIKSLRLYHTSSNQRYPSKEHGNTKCIHHYQQLTDLESMNEKLSFLKDLHESDNLRLRTFISNMQHQYESTIRAREWQIEHLESRNKFLEEELYHLSQNAQKPMTNQVKDTYDPRLLRDLQRQLELKDDEIDILKVERNLQDLQLKVDMLVNEAKNQERKRVLHEESQKSMPFVLENEALKKQNGVLSRQLEDLKRDIQQLSYTNSDLNGQIDQLKGKVKDFQELEKQKLEKAQRQEPLVIRSVEDKNLLAFRWSARDYALCEGVNLRRYFRAVCEICQLSIIEVEEFNNYFYPKFKGAEITKRERPDYNNLSLQKKQQDQIVYQSDQRKSQLNSPSDKGKVLHQKVQSQVNPNGVRNEQNQWLETHLENVTIQNKKKNSKEQNKVRNIAIQCQEFLHLYRLLALKYRTLYPILGDKPCKVDLDLRICLENKICQSLLRIFLNE